MADEKPSAGKDGGVKRPQATLDLKATEIKVAQAAGKPQSSPATASTASTSKAEPAVPRPLPARSYAQSTTQTASGAKSEAARSAPSQREGFAGGTAKDAATPLPPRKPGGFFTHLAAGIAGGLLALAAWQWALPQLGVQGPTWHIADDTATISQRLSALEQAAQSGAQPESAALAARVANLEKTTQAIPAMVEGQKRLVAETKAALASAASDAGSTQLIDRLGKVEDKLKALAEAGASDPNAGRIEQLASLTGKIADVETSLSTQLAALRSSMAKDVEVRMQAATEASEAARSGTQRIDKDLATVKRDAVRLEERLMTTEETSDHTAADLKLAKEETGRIKTALDDLKASTAKPADVSSAIAPLSEHIAVLEKNVDSLKTAETARKESTERVVLALELQNLRRALDSGQKYSTELDEVKRIAGSRLNLDALTRLQDTGVPTLADLAKEFRAAADRAIDTDSEPENATVVDRLWAGAKSVVRVRRIDLKPDDKSTEATIGRMQIALNDGRLSDVLEAAKDLSAKAQDAARPFLDKVAARESIDQALRSLETDLKSSLSSGASEPTKLLPNN